MSSGEIQNFKYWHYDTIYWSIKLWNCYSGTIFNCILLWIWCIKHVIKCRVTIFSFQNRELQIMRRLEHCNIVKLKYFFYSSGDKVRYFLTCFVILCCFFCHYARMLAVFDCFRISVFKKCPLAKMCMCFWYTESNTCKYRLYFVI